MSDTHTEATTPATFDPIVLTEQAVKKVRAAMQKEGAGPEKALRIGVVGGGCSGFSYTMGFDDPKNDDARIGLGTIRFVRSIETLSQGLYRYGLKTPRSFLLPILRLPVPENPNPDPLTFADFLLTTSQYNRSSLLAHMAARGSPPLPSR